ncbi:cyclopropane-fatty-acyl-phospholipid synthase, partial [Laccaria bicolor S238N-H82]
AEIRVVNDSFWVRLCTMSDLGFAEAFMYGDVQCDDLISLFQIFLINKDNLSNLNSRFSYLMSLPQKLTSYRFLNTIGNSRSNISAHYDISNDMFAGFLSEDMTYSCAILDEKAPAPTRPEDELKTSQTRKLQHIIKKAGIRDGNRVLEIGSGWGSMAMTIAQQYPNVTVDTLTLSVQQQSLAQDRIRALGPDIANRITVHLVDYRAMPAEWEGVFDRVISVEMIENVGHEFLERYWSVVDWAMKKKGGVGVVQVITIPEALFPGGLLPSLTFLLQTLQSGSKGRLVVDSISNIGPHYARTLREWRRRFEAKFESVIVPALRREYPDVMAREEVEVFRRKWIYYYCYCEIGFTTRTLGGKPPIVSSYEPS